jgi:DNA-binding NtrC family response regulator
MRILLVEDDPYKKDHINNLLLNIDKKFEVDISNSVTGAYRNLEVNFYDLVVLDMSLPNFSTDIDPTGGMPVNYGGEDIIDYIARLDLKCKVILITQYSRFTTENSEIGISEIASEIQLTYPDNYWGFIHYNLASDTWKKELTHQINSIRGENNENTNS